MNPQVTDPSTHLFERLWTDRWQERREHLAALLIAGHPRAERVAQERERRDLMVATPVAVLAVHDLGFVGVQPQSDLVHPRRERGKHAACFPLRRTVHH